MTTDELAMHFLKEFWGGRIDQETLEALLRTLAPTVEPEERPS